ncbi:MAG: hypothetical protein LLF96_00995 [Eubacteriales bacterium]|nr:hypothetical protein [Eubacteriales bacterium]
MKRGLSLLLALMLVIGLALPLAGAIAEDARPTLTVFDFTEELDQYLINNATTIKQMEDDLGVNLEIEVVSGMSTEEKTSTMIASGDYADIMFRVDERMIEAGALLPLDDLLESDGQDVLAAWGDSINKLRYPDDGNIYWIGSPRNRPEEITDPGACLMVQYEVLDKLGYPTIKTLDDVYQMLNDYLAIQPDLNGTPFIPWGIWADSWGYNHTVNNPALWVNGFTDDSNAYVDQQTYDVTYFTATDYFKNYVSFLNKLYLNNLLSENAFITKYDEFNSQVASGRVLAMIYNASLASDSEAALRAAGMPERCYARFPILADESVVDRSNVYCESYDNGVGISTSCSDPALAMKVINYIASLKGNILFNWGIEGVHYDVIDGKRVWKEEVAQKFATDPNYRYQEGIDCLGWWPLYYGSMKLDDGDYACPQNKQAFYGNADDWTKKVLDAYGITCWGDNFDTSGTPTPYGYGWTLVIQAGSDAELALTKADTVRHTEVPTVVMSQTQEEFDANFASMVDKLYNECKINLWEDAMKQAILDRMEIWGGQK